MTKTIYALLAVGALVVAFFIGRYFPEHEGASLALQKSCADAAVKVLQDSGGDHYMTHYNVAQNKCFVLVASSGLVNDGKEGYTRSTIADVFEHVDYGVFYGTAKRTETQYTPEVCRMLGDDGKWIECKTTPEWEAFAKRLMKE